MERLESHGSDRPIQYSGIGQSYLYPDYLNYYADPLIEGIGLDFYIIFLEVDYNENYSSTPNLRNIAKTWKKISMEVKE